MKKLLLALVLWTFLISWDLVYATVWAVTDADIAQNQAAAAATPTPTPIGASSSNILNQGNEITDQDLRTGNVSMDTIPKIIISVINVLLGVAGTVAVVALIYYAVQMQINSGITGDSSKLSDATKWMRWALIWFVVAILAWFIVIRFVEILSSVS
jgi:Type IV secretion system pilin